PTLHSPLFFLISPRPPTSTLFPYTTLFRSWHHCATGSRACLMSSKSRSLGTWQKSGAPGPAHCIAWDWHGWSKKHYPMSSNMVRSEEHTSELQSRENLVCRLLLEKKKKIHI